MTDIVDRLRTENSSPPYYGIPKLQADAATEIERLRAVLHRISLGSQDSGTTKKDLGKEARAALANDVRITAQPAALRQASGGDA
jgi:hypothetical protein